MSKCANEHVVRLSPNSNFLDRIILLVRIVVAERWQMKINADSSNRVVLIRFSTLSH